MDHVANDNPKTSCNQFDDHWRGWVAESLLSGKSRAAVERTLREHCFREEDIRLEIKTALESPYWKVAERFANRLRKRDWFLKNEGKLHSMAKNCGPIDRRSKLAVEVFYEEYYLKNKPVVITDMLDDWPAVRRWDLEYLRKKLGDRTVEIQFDRNSNKNYEAEHKRHSRAIALSEYIDLIIRHSPTNDFYLTARNNNPAIVKMCEELWDDLGKLPYLDGKNGAIWIGPAGTITPTHHDLNNNMMVQLVGRKKVFIAPPHEVVNLYNDRYVYSPVLLDAVDGDAYPLAKEARIVEYELQPREILFIPVGWWHHVEALDISVTMTHLNFIYDNDFSSHYLWV